VEQTELLKFVVESLEKLSIPYMVVGSYASLVLGEPRMTLDIDIVIDLKVHQVSQFCSSFPASEFYLSEAAVRDAVRSRAPFNVLHPTSGNKIDFILPRDDEWGRLQLARRQRVKLLPDREGYTASPEDVILGKMWYYDLGGSEKHLRDIAGILRVSGALLDRGYLDTWSAKLGYADTWKTIQEREATTR
jgi:hypothetical protein